MNPIRHIRCVAAALAGLACAWLGVAAAAPAAFAAVRVPPSSGDQTGIAVLHEPTGWNKHPPLPGQAAVRVAEHHESLSGEVPAPSLAAHMHRLVHQASGPVPVHTVVIGGMPGWQIALIAAAAALIAATVAVLVDRARTARRKSATTAA
jgi:hypothetical protein